MVDLMKKSSCAACVGPFYAVAQCESGVHSMSSRAIRFSAITFAMALGLVIALVGVIRAGAAQPTVGLGTADSFAILAGTTVTNTGPSTISGNVGVSPGSAVTGFPPGIVTNGTIHAADAVAAQAQSDLTTAYDDAAGRTPCSDVGADLVGQTLVSGVYCNPHAGTLGLTGTVTLDAQGNPDAVFIFQSARTLITASDSHVAVINGAQACNVFWEVGSSATLGTNSVFVGTVLALTKIEARTGAAVLGRLLARNADVTLDTNTVTSPMCAATTVTTTTTTTTTPATTTTTTPATTTTTTPATTTTTTTAPTTTTTTAPATTTTTAPTTTTAAPTTTTAAAGSGSSGTTGGSSSGTAATLAFTGANLTATILAGLLAMILGVMMLLAARRRATDEDFRR
jgi:hypothetical protein